MHLKLSGFGYEVFLHQTLFQSGWRKVKSLQQSIPNGPRKFSFNSIHRIDSLCGQRGEGTESEASRCIKTELLVQMQITPPPINIRDFDRALWKQKPTVSKANLEVHEVPKG